MKRLLTTRLLTIAACAICIPMSAAAVAHAQVIPFVDCHTTDGTHWTSWFGYTNPDPGPITLPAGTAENFFLAAPSDRGQPSTFLPGTFHRVFSVTFTATPQTPSDAAQIIWTVNQQRAVDGAPSVLPAGEFPSPLCPNTVLNGSGPPTDTLGNDGDFYIDTAAHVLYGPKAVGHWPAPGVPLVGPAGATGATGPQGPAGMPVCRNTPATILACDGLFVPGTWTIGPKLHAADVLTRGHTVYARGTGTVTPSGRLTLRLHKLRGVTPGRYTLTVRLTGHGINVTIRRKVTIS